MLLTTRLKLNGFLWLGILSCFISTLSFFLVVGVARLNPLNIGWLSRGGWNDLWAHYVGWESFRRDSWRIPLGENHLLGENLGNSIVYTDSIPILAILFKPFTNMLPEHFQYFGLWLLLCFVLQSFVSAMILSKLTDKPILILLGSNLLLFSPILFNRIGVHPALSSHFLILIALYIFLDKPKTFSTKRWNLLLMFSVSIHVYLFAINLFLYLAWMATFQRQEDVHIWRKLKALSATLITLSFLMWILGYFVALGSSFDDSVRNLSAPFSNTLFKFDLMQPFNFFGWSLLASDYAPNLVGNFDAFGYLGPGFIFIFGLTLLRPRIGLATLSHLMSKYSYLVLAIFLMFLYALTNQITVAKRELLSFDLPTGIVPITEIFRSAGRFSWPLLYAVMFFLLYIVFRGRSFKKIIAVLIFANILQVGDTSYFWRNISPTGESTNVRKELVLPKSINERIAESSTRIVGYFDASKYWEPCPYWDVISYAAIINSISTNCIRTSKMKVDSLVDSSLSIEKELYQARLRHDTTYFLNGFFDVGKLAGDYLEPLRAQRSSHEFIESSGYIFLIPKL